MQALVRLQLLHHHHHNGACSLCVGRRGALGSLCGARLSPRMMGGGAKTRPSRPRCRCSPKGPPATSGSATAARPARASGVRSPTAASVPRLGPPGPGPGCASLPAPPAAAPFGCAPSPRAPLPGTRASRTLPRAVRNSRRARPPSRGSPAGLPCAVASPASAAAAVLVVAAEASQASSAAPRAGQDGA